MRPGGLDSANRLTCRAYFFLCWADNQLFIDSDSDFALRIVFDALERYKSIRIIEHVGQSIPGLFGSGGKGFASQIIIPTLHVGGESNAPVYEHINPGEQRDFLPGSEWLFVKIYCGPHAAERILTDSILPVIKKLLSEGVINCWFYVRYYDQGHHLRLRLRCKAGTWGAAQPLALIGESLSTHLYFGTVSKICVDTYQRELERYSGISYQIVESIFCFESTAVLELISSGLATDRMMIALAATYMLLEDLALTQAEMKEFFFGMAKALAKKAGANQHRLNQKFRAHRALIQQTLGGHIRGNTSPLALFFTDRSKTIQLAAKRPVSRQRKHELAASFIHMFLNRLFAADHMQQELLHYHYLYKFITGQQAKEKNGNKK